MSITPLPWKIEGKDSIIGTTDEIGDIICLSPRDEGWSESDENWPANAAFICKAVNNHEKLMAAVLLAARWFDLNAKDHATSPSLEDLQGMEKAMKDALAMEAS